VGILGFAAANGLFILGRPLVFQEKKMDLEGNLQPVLIFSRDYTSRV
jgi:hypothetical protein